jgi:hypothetical protein
VNGDVGRGLSSFQFGLVLSGAPLRFTQSFFPRVRHQAQCRDQRRIEHRERWEIPRVTVERLFRVKLHDLGGYSPEDSFIRATGRAPFQIFEVSARGTYSRAFARALHDLAEQPSELLQALPQVVGIFCDDPFNLLLARRLGLRRWGFGVRVTFVASGHGLTLFAYRLMRDRSQDVVDRHAQLLLRGSPQWHGRLTRT